VKLNDWPVLKVTLDCPLTTGFWLAIILSR
jgi:hypothetical protein